ncbi:MAG: S9 family peptidase [Saprospiraceae bacterium]
MKTPVAPKYPKQLQLHNDIRVDDYYWMNDRENPETIAYLQAENSYTEQYMRTHAELQNNIYQEIIGRIAPDDVSVPTFDNAYWYYTRFEAGKEYPIICRKLESLEAPEQILLDCNVLAEGHKYYHVGGIKISPDNKWLVYGEDTVSRRQYTLRFKNLVTGETLDKAIPNTSAAAEWSEDSKYVFYTVKDEQSLRSCKVLRHALDEPSAHSDLIFEEIDETFICAVSKTRSAKFLLIGSYATVSTEFQFLDATDPEGRFEIIEPRSRDHEYTVDHHEDHFYIVSNWKARNFRLMKTPVGKQGREHWTEQIAHREEILLEDIDIFNDFYVLSERINGNSELCVVSWSTGEKHYITLGEGAYCIYTSINPEFKTNALRFSYTSMKVPNSVYEYHVETGKSNLLKQQIIVGGYNAADYESARIFAANDEGVKIPISLVYNKSMRNAGPQALLLYAYGSYGHSMDSYFSQARISLLDRGWIYAIAHVRGGQEMGRHWYDDGKLLRKKNTFSDFILCAEQLIQLNYTDAEHLAAMGGSAGGLLMGAVMNMRPDLFKAIVAAVPFVDVVTTMLDDTIPLTTGEYDEWGNPNDPPFYEYIKSYSPYDNVKAQHYPATLVTTGLHDSQVQYWEPAKWVAKLRALKLDKQPLLLHCNMDTGHGGASGRYEMFKEVAMEYTFLLKVIQ